ncbi:MAG: hypothetical protein MET45_12785 [Nostoc sp. LLA-1]|nr:hypothetical protein [Cyanocohniella sp. LLY]
MRWEAINDTSARGTLTDGVTTVSLVFRFNPEGAIATIRAEARYRMDGDKLTAMPWGGRFWGYAVRNEMLIPLEGEVGWEHPEGTRLYWQGRIAEINYEFAQ